MRSGHPEDFLDTRDASVADVMTPLSDLVTASEARTVYREIQKTSEFIRTYTEHR